MSEQPTPPAANHPVRLNAGNIGEILARYDTILCDVDGVLWRVDTRTSIAGTAEAIEKLRDRNKRVMFVSNNCTQSRESLAAKFERVAGFRANIEDIMAVNWAAAIHLKEINKNQGKCYMVADAIAGVEFDLVGVKHCGIGPDPEHIGFNSPTLHSIDLDPDVNAVYVAMDEDISFSKISRALSYLAKPDCLFLGSSVNEIAAKLQNRVLPLSGTFLAAIATGARREPTIIGKPSSHFMACIRAAHPQLDLSRTLMIGDTITGDMEFARNVGIDSLLVLSGFATESDIEKLEGTRRKLRPDYVAESLAEIGTWLS